MFVLMTFTVIPTAPQTEQVCVERVSDTWRRPPRHHCHRRATTVTAAPLPPQTAGATSCAVPQTKTAQLLAPGAAVAEVGLNGSG